MSADSHVVGGVSSSDPSDATFAKLSPDSNKPASRSIGLLMQIYRTTPELGDFCLDLYNENRSLKAMLGVQSEDNGREVDESLALLRTFDRLLRQQPVTVKELAQRFGLLGTARVIAGLVSTGSVRLDGEMLVYDTRFQEAAPSRIVLGAHEEVDELKTSSIFGYSKIRILSIAKVSLTVGFLGVVAFGLCDIWSLAIVSFSVMITSMILWRSLANDVAYEAYGEGHAEKK